MGSQGRASADERARLRAIRSVDLEEARPIFERIARTAQRLTRAPVAHVSIIEADRIWVAGVAERPVPPIAREHAFATYAAESDTVLWIENLTADPRFN